MAKPPKEPEYVVSTDPKSGWAETSTGRTVSPEEAAGMPQGKPGGGIPGKAGQQSTPALTEGAMNAPDNRSRAGTPGTPGSFWQLPVLERQKLLKKAGYNVELDGLAGAQTFTASKAYVKGIPAGYWNRVWARNHPVAKAAAPAAPGVNPAAAAGDLAAAATPPPAGGDETTFSYPNFSAPPTPIGKLRTQARELVESSMLPYRQEVERQQKAAAERAAARVQGIEGFSGGLAQLLAGIGPQVQETYRDAASDQSMIAKGFSDGLKLAAGEGGAESNRILDLIGAPEGQRLTGESAAAGADVAYGLGGFIPASSLGREGAAFASAAALLPATAAGRGQEDAKLSRAEAETEQQRFAQQLLDIAAQQPGLEREQLLGLQQLDESQRNAAWQRYIQGRSQAFTEQSFGVRQKQEQAQLDQRSQEMFIRLFGYDPVSGEITPEMRRVILNEQKARQSAANGGFTPKQLKEIRAEAGDVARAAWFGGYDKDDNELPRLSYQEAMREMLASGIPLAIAQQELNRFWRRPGYDAERTGELGDVDGVEWVVSSGGRPKQPYQVRAKGKK